MQWSKYQVDIFDAFTNTQDSLLIEAVAGSGKTRTLEELARIMGERFPSQRGIMVAFNKSIAMELQTRIDKYGFRNVQAMTLHSAGWSAWRRAGRLDWEPRVDNAKVHKIMREVLSYEEVKRFGETTRKLVAAAKGIGLVPRLAWEKKEADLQGLVDDDNNVWEALIDHYGMDEDECQVDCARRVLAWSIELGKETVDFDDMLYMPVIAGVPFDKYDVVLVDEAQDVSGIQMEMIERMANGGRVIACGDRKQSIFGFRGAGTNSMDELKQHFQMTELPLSVTYRCPRAVVLHSRQWVRQIEWSDTAGDGYVGLEGTDWQGQAGIALGADIEFSKGEQHENASISNSFLTEGEGLRLSQGTWSTGSGSDRICAGGISRRDNALDSAHTPEGVSKWRGIRDFQPGDAVLCRLTRPLVAAAFAMIRNRIPCRVLGRDIGAGLVAIVKKGMKSLQAGTVGEFSRWLDDYQQREGQRLTDKGKRAQAGLLGDRCDTIRVFMDGMDPEDAVTMLISDIERLFVDNGGASGMVTLATVHKAKGLEWERVFVLDAGEFMPCPWARGGGWEAQQERNCMYIAATRAIRELRYIKTGDLR